MQKKYEKKLFGTKLEIAFFSCVPDEVDIKHCFLLAEGFEKKYSRFLTGNFLERLNTEKIAYGEDFSPGESCLTFDDEFSSLLHLCQKVSRLSNGYFDITVLPILENIGYGIQEKVFDETRIGYQNIEISQEKIELKNGVQIELGAVGKGFMVDKLYNFLAQKYEDFIINFGGDIRVSGTKKILLEDPNDDTKQIGFLELSNASLSSSGKNKRILKKGHHLINPKEKKSENGKQATFVSHPLTAFSDIFATALFVAPVDIGIKMLNKVKDLEALIILENGEIYKTTGFHCELEIT